MKKVLLKPTLVATVVMSLTAGSAFAANTNSGVNNVNDTVNQTSRNAENSMNQTTDKMGQFADDSGITAKVKKAFMDDKMLSAMDISVKTDKGVVALSGFVDSAEKKAHAVSVAKQVEGVKSVQDQLNLKDAKEGTVKGYMGDAATTAEVKAKLLGTKDMPSTSISVETVDGVVQLTGSVDTAAQIREAESVAKQVDGVKSVKNDLKVK